MKQTIDGILFVEILRNEGVPHFASMDIDGLIIEVFFGKSGSKVFIYVADEILRDTARSYLNQLGRMELIKLLPFS